MREHHGRGEPGQLRARSTASSHHLERHAVAAGAVELSDAIAHWWVLDDDHRARRREATLWASTGHAAAVYGDELYDVLPQTRGGYGRLQDFGIRFGYERVVLHLEPQVQAGRLECNTARTLLLLDHEPLPWSRWGEEFAAAMPDEILRLQERAASADGIPRQEAIRNRVSAILPLYRLSRYRPTPPAARAPRPAATDARDESPADTPAAGPAAPPRQPTADTREHARRRRTQRTSRRGDEPLDGRPGRRGRARADGRPARRRVDLRARRHPARRATSKTRPPATTPAATS